MNRPAYPVTFFLSCRPAGTDVLPFDPETMAVRYCDKSCGKSLLHNISQRADPKVQSETDTPNPQPQTATTRHEHLRRDERIGNDAVKIAAGSSSTTCPPSSRPVAAAADGLARFSAWFSARRDMDQIPAQTMTAVPQIRCLTEE
jgi:hypothetical protein